MNIKAFLFRYIKKHDINGVYLYRLHRKEFRQNTHFIKYYNKELKDEILIDGNKYKEEIVKFFDNKCNIYITSRNLYSLYKGKYNNLVYIRKNSDLYFKKLAETKSILFYNTCPAFFVKSKDQIISLVIDEPNKKLKKTWESTLEKKAFFMANNIIYFSLKNAQNYLYNNDLSKNHRSSKINAINDFKKNDLFNKTKFINNKKTILFYPSYLMGNGVTETFITLLNELDYDKYDVYVAVNNKSVYYDKQERINKNANLLYFNEHKFFKNKKDHDEIFDFFQGKKICNLDMLKSFCEINNRAIISDLTFDYIIDYNGYSPFVSSMACLGNEKGRKIIYMHNDLYKDCITKNYQLKNVFYLYQFYERIVGVSKGCYEVNKEKIEKYVKENYNFSIEKKMTYILNPVNYQAVIDGSKENNVILKDGNKYLKIKRDDGSFKYLEIPDNKNINFVSIGRLSQEKNFSMLIDAFNTVYSKNKNIRLYIIGDGIDKEKLRHQINNLKLNKVVFLVGYTVNPYDLLSRCDCYILSSLYEGLGMVILESMILNKYVISSNIDGPKEIVKDGYGTLVDINVESFAREMEKFIKGKYHSKKFDYKKYNKEALKLFYENVLR